MLTINSCHLHITNIIATFIAAVLHLSPGVCITLLSISITYKLQTNNHFLLQNSQIMLWILQNIINSSDYNSMSVPRGMKHCKNSCLYLRYAIGETVTCQKIIYIWQLNVKKLDTKNVRCFVNDLMFRVI